MKNENELKTLTLSLQPDPPYRVGDELVLTLATESQIEIQFQKEELPALIKQGFLPHEHAKITVIKPGEWLLPSLKVLNSKGDILGKTEPLKLQVNSVIDKNNPQDQKPDSFLGIANPALPPVLKWTLVGMSGLALLILFVMCIRLIKKFKKRREEYLESLLTPAERALREVTRLEKLNYIQTRRYKEFYFQSSEILKRYLQRKYQIELMDATSDECLSRCYQKIKIREYDMILEWFPKMDSVKFSDRNPAQDECDLFLKQFKGELAEHTENHNKPHERAK
jgi:hypothetical protein